jgi:hypothetical protein
MMMFPGNAQPPRQIDTPKVFKPFRLGKNRFHFEMLEKPPRKKP